jgi:hypothetical protein
MTDTGRCVADEGVEIVLDEPHEATRWTQNLGMTEKELRAAIPAAGTVAPEQR